MEDNEMVTTRITVALFVSVLTATTGALGQPPDSPSPSALVDPSSTLDTRIDKPDPTVLAMFADAGLPTPTHHVLTDAEHQAFAQAVEALPPVHRRVLRAHLRRISFLDGMPNTALTSTVDADAPAPLYDLTIRAGVLHETVSEFLTQKERTCFDVAGSTRTVVVDAGTLPAIVYVLLHEATHMVDSALGLTPAEGDTSTGAADGLTAGVWTDRLTVAPAYASPLLERLAYRRGGRPLRVSEAQSVYAALRRTPFASLYASSNWHDDVAELLAWHHLTSRMGQPYRIVVREGQHELLVYAPMASPLVRSRLRLLARLYDPAMDSLAEFRPAVP